MPRRRVVLGLLAAVLGTCVLASTGCVDVLSEPGDERKLAALEREPLATMKLPGGRLVLRTKLEDGKSLGKPTSAQILSVFAYRYPERAAVGRRAAIDAALASGWKLNLERNHPAEWLYGAKTLTTGDATLTIHRYDNEGVQKVSVNLGHSVCPAALCSNS